MVGGGEVLAALVLRGTEGVGPVRYRALVERFGSAASALGAPLGELSRIAGIRVTRDPRDNAGRRRAEALLERCRARGIRVFCLGQPGYPQRLLDLSDPPPVLFALGDMELLRGSCAAVVGSRRATAYGRRTARRIGRFLAEQGRPVVSGMAMGIDEEAHRGALPGPTVAVLGSGVDVPTPRRNAPLYREIEKSGLILSTFDPGTPAAAHHFPARNRVIAALSRDIIVVEAAARSGALLTAGFGLDLGREIHAVPGPIDRPTSVGTNRLISDGASMISEISPTSPLSPLTSREPSDPDLRAFYHHVPSRPASIDDIARGASVPVPEASVLLTRLQLQGFVSRTSDGLVLRTPGVAAAEEDR